MPSSFLWEGGGASIAMDASKKLDPNLTLDQEDSTESVYKLKGSHNLQDFERNAKEIIKNLNQISLSETQQEQTHIGQKTE